MRWMTLLAGLIAAALQAGCGDVSPQSLGITGPGAKPEPVFAPDDTLILPPGLPDPSTGSGPEQRFYRYN